MNQLTRGQTRRLMYIENKDGDIDGVPARIGWATFSKTGRTVYYRGLVLSPLGGRGVRGNFVEATTGHEYWVSGVKKRGGDAHHSDPVKILIDDDALEEYERQTGSVGSKSP